MDFTRAPTVIITDLGSGPIDAFNFEYLCNIVSRIPSTTVWFTYLAWLDSRVGRDVGAE